MFNLELGCTDTPAWHDWNGNDCRSYGENYCRNGAVIPGQEEWLGYQHNNPETHCCVCGKAKDVQLNNRGALIQNVTVPAPEM